MMTDQDSPILNFLQCLSKQQIMTHVKAYSFGSSDENPSTMNSVLT